MLSQELNVHFIMETRMNFIVWELSLPNSVYNKIN